MNKGTVVPRKEKNLKSPTSRTQEMLPFADKISFIRSLILDSVEPETVKKIYLFGSYAYGKPTKKSDIDLCIVIKDNLDRSNIYLKIARSLYMNNIIPADIVVYEEKIFYDIKNQNGIKNTIFTKGRILYE